MIRRVKRRKEHRKAKGSKETKKEGDRPINVIHVAGYTHSRAACCYPRSVFISSLLKGTEIVPELREAQSTKLCRGTMRDSRGRVSERGARGVAIHNSDSREREERER